MFELGEGEKTKTKGANSGRRCGRPPTGGAERGAGWSWVRQGERRGVQAGAGFDRGSGEGCRLELGSKGRTGVTGIG